MGWESVAVRRRRFLGGAAALTAVGCGDLEPQLAEGSADDTSEASTGSLEDGEPMEGDERLNVVFITADDLGWKALDDHGWVDHCPNLRTFGARAQRFTHAFNVTSSCSSSRASFATGQFPSEHGVRGLVHRFPSWSLPTASFTVAKALANAGYRTGIAGKFHISDTDDATQFGYQELGPRRLETRDDLEFALEFVAANANAPFFLELNFTQTHRRGNPRRFPQHPDHPVSSDDVRVPAYWALPDIPEIRACLAGYLSQFCSMDAMIGTVLEQLRSQGLLDTTMVLFVSDNGVSVPNNKSTLYDRGTGSPCILHDPRVRGGEVTDTIVSSIDYAATMLDAAGLDASHLPGIPLGLRSTRYVFSEMHWHASRLGMRAVRSARWKFIANLSTDPVGSGEVSEDWEERLDRRPWREERETFELYDLDADPHEQHNVVYEEPLAAAELHDALDGHVRRVADEERLPPLEP